jgi:hypothetical protein
MADDESALRELLARTAVRFEPLDGAAVRAAAEHRKRHRRVRRVLLPVTAALSVAGIAATVSLVVAHQASTAGPAGTGAATHTAPRRVGGRSTPAAHAFQVRLVLPGTSFPADGRPIHAYVLAINHTGSPVVINNACNGWLEAGLTGEHVTFTIFNGAVGCASKTIAPGTTRIQVSILTTFTQCQQGRREGTPGRPHCIGPHDDRLPKLPPGAYRAVVRTQSTSIRPVLSKPQPITLTAVR